MIIGISGKQQHGKDTVANIINYLFWMKGIKEEVPNWEEIYDTTILSGDSFIEWLENAEEGDGGWKIKKFAGKLKEIASLLTGVPLERWEDNDFKNSLMPEQWNKWRYFDEVSGIKKYRYFNDYETAKRYYFYGNKEASNASAPLDIEYVQITYRLFLQLLGTEAMREGLHVNTWVNALLSDFRPGEQWLITDVRFPNEYNAVKEWEGLKVKVIRNVEDSGDKHASETSLENFEFDYVIDNGGTLTDLVINVEEFLKYYKLL